MSMQALTKALTDDRGRGWYEENRKYNEDNDCRSNTLEYFAFKAANDYGLAPDTKDMERREKQFLRRFKVGDEEFERQEKVIKFAWDSWALEKYFSEQGLPWRGPMSPTVEKAFTTNSVLGVFPVFYEQAITAGRLTNPILDRLVTDTVAINSGTASHVELTDTATTPSGAVETNEGARSAQVTIQFRERTVPLKEFVYEALSTYEASRRARLPVLQRGLERVGRRFQYVLTEFGLEVIVTGDAGTPANPATTYPAATTGTQVYADWVNLYYTFPQEYSPSFWIGSAKVAKQMLALPEFADPLAGGAFANRGILQSPIGVPLLRWDSKGISSTYTDTKVIGVDGSTGLTEYTEGGIITQAEQLISSGWNKVVTRQWVGFAKNDNNGFVVGTGFAT